MTLRQFLSVFLMLLMITPAMVCVMTCCPDEAEAAETAAPPCHKDMGHHKASEKPVMPKLAGDCLKNDLGQTAYSDVPMSQDSFIMLAFVFTPLLLAGAAGERTRHHRGADPPPRRRPSFHRLLITQRFLQ